MPTWWRYNPATHIFEHSLNEGTSWAPPPLNASIINEGIVDPAHLPPATPVPPNIAFTNVNNNFSASQTIGIDLHVAGMSKLFGGTGVYFTDAPLEIQAANPRVTFHWPGIAASQIGIDTAGIVRTYDLGGTSYVTFAAANYAFPATQVASGNPNILDDYEEGTWGPYIYASGGGSATQSAWGLYTKIGNKVFVSGRITLSNKGSIVGNLNIAGLPFTIGPAGYHSLCVAYVAGFSSTNVSWITGFLLAGNGHLGLYHSVNVSPQTGLIALAPVTISNAWDIIFSASYLT